MAEIVFELRDVWKYRVDARSGQSVPVLQGISVQVRPGSLITVIGPSGAGKSTLLWLFNRLEDPDRGALFFLGKELAAWNVLELRRRVGLVFQQPVMLSGTVEENLLYGPRLIKREEEVEPRALLSQVGLSGDMLNRPAHKLSGGEQQRVALARTLVNEPQVLLLDEITSSLDLESEKIIEEFILELNRKGLTCLWVTHDLDQARRLDGETWVLIGGRLVETGPTRQIFAGPRHSLTAAFLRGNLRGEFGGEIS